MLAKRGQEWIARKKRLRCDVYVHMKGHRRIVRLCRRTRWVTDLNDACGDETRRGRGRGTRRACVGHLLCFALSMAKAEEGHALRPGKDVGGRRDASLEGANMRYKMARADDRCERKARVCDDGSRCPSPRLNMYIVGIICAIVYC